MSSSGTSKGGPEAAADPKNGSAAAAALSNGSAAAADEDETMDSGTDQQQQQLAIPAQPALHLTSDEVNYLIFRYVKGHPGALCASGHAWLS